MSDEQTAADAIVARIEANPKYHELKRKRNRLGWTLTVMMLVKFGASHPQLPLLMAVALPLCAVGGLCWGLLTWFFNERIFRALHHSR